MSLGAIVGDLLYFLLLFVLGFGVLSQLKWQFSALEVISMIFPIGIGINSLLLFWFSLAGVPLNFLVIWIAPFLGLAVLVFLRLKVLNKPISFSPIQSLREILINSSLSSKILVIGVGAVTLLALLQSIYFAYGNWDGAAIWAGQGYGISLESSIFAVERWGSHGMAYPLNIPLAISVFKTLSGDLLPTSKVIFPIFLASASLGLAGHALARRGQPWLVVLGSLTFISAPVIFIHGTSGFADLPFSTYLVLGVLWGVRAMEKRAKSLFLLSGVLLAISTWTRPEGIGYVVLVVLLCTALHQMVLNGKIHWLYWLAPILVAAIPWTLLSMQHVANSAMGVSLQDFTKNILAGNLNLRDLYLIPRLFLDRALNPDRWGYLFPAITLILLFSLGRFDPRRNPAQFTFAALTVLIALIPVGLFYVQSFTRGSEYIPMINRSFDRAFFPATMMLTFLVMTAFPETERVELAE
jgi:hypothetical protein